MSDARAFLALWDGKMYTALQSYGLRSIPRQ